jgi:hypothetical protein
MKIYDNIYFLYEICASSRGAEVAAENNNIFVKI